MAGRVATVILFVLSSSLVFVLQTAQESFNIILQIGAGTGLLYLLRWFWWRVTAWCEIVAMTSSFAASLAFLFLHQNGIALGTHVELVLSVAFTTFCWILTAFIGPQTDHATLISFYKKVHPLGPGWTRIREEAGVPKAEAAEYARQDNIPLAMLGWVCGTAVIWSGLFSGRQCPVWAHRLRARSARHPGRNRLDPHLGDQALVEVGRREAYGPELTASRSSGRPTSRHRPSIAEIRNSTFS